jgi:hypothetical protein
MRHAQVVNAKRNLTDGAMPLVIGKKVSLELTYGARKFYCASQSSTLGVKNPQPHFSVLALPECGKRRHHHQGEKYPAVDSAPQIEMARVHRDDFAFAVSPLLGCCFPGLVGRTSDLI